MGFNPGGDPNNINETVGQSIANFPLNKENPYLDEKWGLYDAGKAPLQRRLQYIFDNINVSLRETPASNLIFTRSVMASDITDWHSMANLCWPVHEKILHIVRPKIILTFGNGPVSPYEYIKSRSDNIGEETIPSGHGTWVCRKFTVPQKYTVIGLPHLSRYNIIGKENVIEWIKEAMQSD